MSSLTTKTEVGRLAGATAASGCLALKLPANTAGRGRRSEDTEQGREKEGKREGSSTKSCKDPWHQSVHGQKDVCFFQRDTAAVSVSDRLATSD